MSVKEPKEVKDIAEGNKGEHSITDYIKLEDYYEPEEGSTLEQAENSRLKGCLLYFLLFVFLVMAIFGLGGMLISSLRGEKEVVQKDENTFKSNTKGYEFLSRRVDDVCTTVGQDGRVYLITSDRYNEYLPMISGCIDISSEDEEIVTYQDGARNYIKYRSYGYVSYIEYYVREHEGRYYMELYSENTERYDLIDKMVAEEVVRELLKGYDKMFSGEA